MDVSVTHHLQRPEGRIGYTVEGSGPLIVALPGMGDLAGSYRELVGPLVDAGYRVAVMDLRGQGMSDVGFADLGDVGNALDLIALIDELGAPAVVLGNSMGAAAAVWAAAERPDAVAGLVLYGPLLRNPAGSAPARVFARLLYRVALAGAWGPFFWGGFYRSINRGAHAPWLEEHIATIVASLREAGRLRSLRHLALQLDHRAVEERIPQVAAPMLSFVGDGDPDFPDPKTEREWLATLGRAVLVENAGHYPHAQRPDVVVPATVEFVSGVLARA